MTQALIGYIAHTNTTPEPSPYAEEFKAVAQEWKAAGHPKSGELYDRYWKLFDLYREPQEVWSRESIRLKELVSEYELYKHDRIEIEAYFKDDTNLVAGSEEIHTEGRYTLKTSSYGTKPGCWSYTKGDVYVEDRLLTTVYRNYSDFWHLFILGHPNGHDYLLCGEDYQGYTVIELDTGKRKNYSPDIGFCWTYVEPSPDKRMLAVDGCFWACPYETVIYDFRNPMQFPLWDIQRFDSSDATWLDATTLRFETEDYKADTDPPTLVASIWERPKDFDLVQDQLRKCVPHWISNGVNLATGSYDLVRDDIIELRNAFEGLTPDEQFTLRTDEETELLLKWLYQWDIIPPEVSLETCDIEGVQEVKWFPSHSISKAQAWARIHAQQDPGRIWYKAHTKEYWIWYHTGKTFLPRIDFSSSKV